MTKIVKEFVLRDGIGAQLVRKINCMCYAHHNGYLFEDTPIEDFFNHPSDNITNQEEKQNFINKFTALIKNPWSHIDFNSMPNKDYCDEIGFLKSENQGVLVDPNQNFKVHSNLFSNIPESQNENIVFHIRRGNVLRGNPRWIDDKTYLNMVKSVDAVVEKLQLSNPKIIILTDSHDSDKVIIPDNELNYWQQPFLVNKENAKAQQIQKEFAMSKIPDGLFDGLRYDVTVLKNYDTYESFLIMCQAKVLYLALSAFSNAAALFCKNNIIDYGFKKPNERYRNSIGYFDPFIKGLYFYDV